MIAAGFFLHHNEIFLFLPHSPVPFLELGFVFFFELAEFLSELHLVLEVFLENFPFLLSLLDSLLDLTYLVQSVVVLILHVAQVSVLALLLLQLEHFPLLFLPLLKFLL